METCQDAKHTFIKNLHNAVKLCQSEFVKNTEVATENNIIVSQLCKEWEAIFLHGIKKRSSKSIFSLKYNNFNEIPNSFIQQIKPSSNLNGNYSFWSFICEFIEHDDILRFSELDKIDTEIGRCRAWLRASINEQTLEPFFINVLSKSGQNISKKYYESYAVLLDGDESSVLPNLAAGISSIMFSLELNNEAFNNLPESNSRSQNNSTSSSISRPILFSSSTSESFEDIEIIESLVKPINNDSNTKNNLRKKNRIINIIPIDDNDDPISDSSDLYSPFNLLKTSVLNTGLNLVSKFQFGNDEKLTNIQEQENNSQLTNNSDADHIPSSTTLINGGFHEFDETEFEDCCLSLQNEFYSPSESKTPNHHVDDKPESYNQLFLSADLVAVEPVSCSPSFISLPTVFPENNSSTNSIPNCINEQLNLKNQEIRNLQSQLLLQSEENERLCNDLNAVKKELEDQKKQFTLDLSKLSRENKLLKNKLKTYISNNCSLEQAPSEEISNDLSGSSLKIEQLLHMHADILELNDQLQRTLVNKDISIGMLQSKISNLMEHEESSGIHFDKLGTIYIGIIDYSQKGNGSNKHFCYKIHIRISPSTSSSSIVESDEWTSYRRYREFHRFYLELLSKNPSLKNIEFPSKWLYKPTQEQLIDRQKGLESFLHTAVAFLFKNTLNRNSCETHSKPIMYESFKRVGRSSWGFTESTNSLNSANFSDESFPSNHSGMDKHVLSRRKVISVIPFLSPNPNET